MQLANTSSIAAHIHTTTKADEKQEETPSSREIINALSFVWHGKYGVQQPTYVPIATKTSGCAPGAIYEKKHTKIGSRKALKKWMGKTGISRGIENNTSKLHTRSIMRRGINQDTTLEKIAADAYILLSKKHYLVPKHRLAMLRIINKFTRENILARATNFGINRQRKACERIEKSVHLMSKMVEGYQDLRDLSTIDQKGALYSLRLFIETYARPPEQVLIEDHLVPLQGIMEIMASSRLLGDTDVLGGSLTNTGFVVRRNHKGQAYQAIAVKVDAGYSFNFSGPENFLLQNFNPITKLRLQDQRDFQFGNSNFPAVISWKSLSAQQQHCFITALHGGIQQLQPSLMSFLVRRDGEFNVNGEEILQENTNKTILSDWSHNIALQTKIYRAELAAIDPMASSIDTIQAEDIIEPCRITFNVKKNLQKIYARRLKDNARCCPHGPQSTACYIL